MKTITDLTTELKALKACTASSLNCSLNPYARAPFEAFKEHRAPKAGFVSIAKPSGQVHPDTGLPISAPIDIPAPKRKSF